MSTWTKERIEGELARAKHALDEARCSVCGEQLEAEVIAAFYGQHCTEPYGAALEEIAVLNRALEIVTVDLRMAVNHVTAERIVARAIEQARKERT